MNVMHALTIQTHHFICDWEPFLQKLGNHFDNAVS